MEYLLDSGNTLNMFEIQKYWNKTFQKDEYFHSKIHCLTLDLICTAELETIFFRLASAFKLVYFSDLLGFKYAYFFVNKTKFVRVLRIHTHLSKNYKHLSQVNWFIFGKRWLITYKRLCCKIWLRYI